MAFTILAVAVGAQADMTFTDPTSPQIKAARPYIRGLIAWLAKTSAQRKSPEDDDGLNTYTMSANTGATDYKIIYRERPRNQLASAFTGNFDLALCLSRSVVDAAVGMTNKPIVGMVSDPASAGYPANVCAASATRPQLISHAARRFKKKAKLDIIYGLTVANYDPAQQAGRWAGKLVRLVTVPAPVDDAAIQAAIDTIGAPPAGQRQGLLVFPVDIFFGAGDSLVRWAEGRLVNPLPTFWTAPDWPPSAYGGFGFNQEVCGQYLASLVASIFGTGAIPDPPYITVDEKPDRRFRAGPFAAVTAEKARAD